MVGKSDDSYGMYTCLPALDDRIRSIITQLAQMLLTNTIEYSIGNGHLFGAFREIRKISLFTQLTNWWIVVFTTNNKMCFFSLLNFAYVIYITPQRACSVQCFHAKFIKIGEWFNIKHTKNATKNRWEEDQHRPLQGIENMPNGI